MNAAMDKLKLPSQLLLDQESKLKKCLTQSTEILKQIHDTESYLTICDTWNEYCETRLGITGRRAYQLMEMCEILKELPVSMRTIVHTEGQARALKKVPVAQREAVVQEAMKETHGHVTAKSIEVAHEKVSPKPTAPQGALKYDARKFERLEDELGGILRKIDALHKDSPNKEHHGNAIRLVKEVMASVKAWQKAAR